MSYHYLFKFTISGDTGTGKTNILNMFTDNRFINTHEITIGVEFGAKIIQINNLSIKIQIWDTVIIIQAGQESFRSITRSYFRGAAAFILVFDLTKRSTFENLSYWLDEVKNNSNANSSIIIVGNKSDLTEQREVTTDEACSFCNNQNVVYIETSAKNNINIERAFHTSVEIILDKIRSGVFENKYEECGIKKGQLLSQNK